MKTAAEILYSFDLAADRLDSKNTINMQNPAKLVLINKAQRAVFKQRYKDFQRSQKRTAELQRFEMIEKEFKLKESSRRENIYSCKRDANIYLVTRRYAIASTECCSGKRIKLHMTESDDFEINLHGSLVAPSFEWRRALVREAEDSFHVYSAPGMQISTLVIDYIRFPKDIDMEGYIHFDGSPSKNVPCETEEFIDDIINEAVFNTKAYSGDPSVQTQAAILQRQE